MDNVYENYLNDLVADLIKEWQGKSTIETVFEPSIILEEGLQNFIQKLEDKVQTLFPGYMVTVKKYGVGQVKISKIPITGL